MKTIIIGMFLTTVSNASSQLFYGGDWEGGPFLEAGIDTEIADARIYDNFDNTSPSLNIVFAYGDFLSTARFLPKFIMNSEQAWSPAMVGHSSLPERLLQKHF